LNGKFIAKNTVKFFSEAKYIITVLKLSFLIGDAVFLWSRYFHLVEYLGSMEHHLRSRVSDNKITGQVSERTEAR